MTPIVYLHGFRSSPGERQGAGDGARDVATLPRRCAVRRSHVPDARASPRRSRSRSVMASWLRAPRETAPLTFVGSSLGGYYATHLAERYGARAVLINPAVRPYDDLAPVPRHADQHVHRRVVRRSPRRTSTSFARSRSRASRGPSATSCSCRRGDEVLDYRESVAYYGGACQFVQGGGDHAFQDFDAQIPAILRFAAVADDAIRRRDRRRRPRRRRDRVRPARPRQRLAMLDERRSRAPRLARQLRPGLGAGQGRRTSRVRQLDPGLGARPVAEARRRSWSRRPASTSRCRSRAACTCACRAASSTSAQRGCRRCSRSRDSSATAIDILDREALARRLPGRRSRCRRRQLSDLDGHCNPLRLLDALHAGLRARGHRLSTRRRRARR